MAVAVETPPNIRFSGTIKESIDRAETPKKDTHRKHQEQLIARG
jgi:hypothetical protein